MYTLESPNHTIFFNDWISEGEYNENVLAFNPDDGVAGLEPVVRKTTKNRPQRHGITVGRGRLGAMTPTFHGTFIHTGPAAQETMRRRLLATLYDLTDQWGTLTWTPSDGSPQRALDVQLLEKPDISGGIIKSFSFMLVAQRPFIRSAALNSAYTSYLSDPLGGGLTFPFTFPLDFVDPGSSGAGTFTNSGDNGAYPVIVVSGPLTNMLVRNYTTGQQIRTVGSALSSSETAVIDMWEETIYRNGDSSTPMTQYLDTVQSEFWEMIPGDNLIGISGSAPDPLVTRARVDWWDSYV